MLITITRLSVVVSTTVVASVLRRLPFSLSNNEKGLSDEPKGSLRTRRELGTLRSNDADGDEIVKNTIGFISKTTALHVHHTFLYISFPFLHDYDVKMPNFVFYGGCKQATTKLY